MTMCVEYGCVNPIEDHNLQTGICDECQLKLKTCTACGGLVENLGFVFITVKDGVKTAQGHQECLKAVT